MELSDEDVDLVSLFYCPIPSQTAIQSANINSPWIRESPFRFLTYKYRFLLEGRQWNCHSKIPIELPASSYYLVFTIKFPVAGQWCRSQQLSLLTRQIVVTCYYSWWCVQCECCVHVIAQHNQSITPTITTTTTTTLLLLFINPSN